MGKAADRKGRHWAIAAVSATVTAVAAGVVMRMAALADPTIGLSITVQMGGPSLSAVSPGRGTAGATLDVTLTGSNLQSGVIADFGSDITINAVTRRSSTEVLVNLVIGREAALGTRDVIVKNLDGQWFALKGGFAVERAVATFRAPTGWDLTGVPLVPLSTNPAELFEELGGKPITYGWGCTRYEFSPSVELGKGLWLLNPTSNALQVTVEGTPAPQGTYPVPLNCGPGWNLVSPTFVEGHVRLGELKLRLGTSEVNWDEAASAGLVLGVAYAWSPENGSYLMLGSGSAIGPWRGVWVLALRENLSLLFPQPSGQALASPGQGPSEKMKFASTTRFAEGSTDNSVKSDGEGEMSLVVECNGARDDVTARFLRDALPSATCGMIPKPPVSPYGVSLAFATPPEANRAYGNRIGTWEKQWKGKELYWDIEAQLPVSAQAKTATGTLRWPVLGLTVPKDYTVILEDLYANRKQALQTTSFYNFETGKDGLYRFRLWVEDRAPGHLVARIVSLRADRASETVRVQYILSEDADVRIVMRTATGRVVAETPLLKGKRGTRETLLAFGQRPLGRGVYLLEVQAQTPLGVRVSTVRKLTVR